MEILIYLDGQDAYNTTLEQPMLLKGNAKCQARGETILEQLSRLRFLQGIKISRAFLPGVSN